MQVKTDRQLLTVLFTDIEGYSALTQRDEAKAMAFVSSFQKIVTETTASSNGEVVHFYGDGSLCAFASSVDAVRCAIEMQSAFRGANGIPVRMGIHLGEVVRREGSIFGNTVNVASRLHDLAPAGSILISEVVSGQLDNHPDIRKQFIGQESVKNIKEPVRIFAIEGSGLVMPSWHDVHSRNKNRNRSGAAIIAGLLIVAAVVGLVERIWSDGQRKAIQERVVVIPFKNQTGDSSLTFIGEMAAHYISRCIDEVEDAKIISYDALVRSTGMKRFGLFAIEPDLRATHAENVIEGSFYLSNDSTIQFTSSLRNIASLEYIEYFPDVSVPKRQYANGIKKVGQRVAGYWMSKDANRLSIPLQDSYQAFIQALRYWGADYPKSIEFLERAIELDSTFIDAYFYLIDAHFNQNTYAESIRADSALTRVETAFDLESLTPTQLRTYHYYSALMDGNNEEAYSTLKEEYLKDPEDIFTNTAMALMAMQFVNEPEEALEILGRIPFDGIDFETNVHFRDRITYAVQASFILGQFEDAARYAEFYPRDIESTVHLKLKARALAGIRDTAAIGKLLNQVRTTRGLSTYASVLQSISRDLTLLRETTMADHYAQLAYKTYSGIDKSSAYLQLLMDSDRIDEARQFVAPYYDSSTTYRPILHAMGIFHARRNETTEALSIINRLDAAKSERFDFGETEYLQSKIFIAIGDLERALLKLSQAIDNGLYFHAYNVDSDPDLLPLAALPDYEEVVHPLRD